MPTQYRIQLKERLDLHWEPWFDDMRFTHSESGTILEGRLSILQRCTG